MFEGEAYNSYLHSIDACVEETTVGKNCFNVSSCKENGGMGGGGGGEVGGGGGEGVTIRREKERISLTIRFVPTSKKEMEENEMEKEERKKE